MRSLLALSGTALLAIVVLLLGAVAPARAADVSVSIFDGGVFVGGDETINVLFITSPAPSTIRVRADVGPITTSDADCTLTANAVDCTVTALVAEVAAGGEDDIVDVAGPIAARLYGGSGGDVLRGGSLDDFLIGEQGGDQLFGRAGNDDHRGDAGADRLDGGEGSDLVAGGTEADSFEDTGAAGTDSITYKVDAVQSGVRITVGDGANDGQDAGLEGDDVRSGFERIQGSNSADVIRGGAAPETINGSSGDDDIDGGAGADTIEGNGGDDVIHAQDGIADTRLDCDAASDPPASNGTADVAFVDAAGTDPEPARCETVNRTGSGGGGVITPPPINTAAPAIGGLRVAGQSLTCTPGTWDGGPTFGYTWFTFAADGARLATASGPSLVVPPAAAGLEVECEVAGTNAGGATRSRAPRVRIAAQTTLALLNDVDRKFPRYTVGTKVCGGKRFCEAEEVRRAVEKLGVPVRWDARAVAGLRDVPRRVRARIRPGAVFKTSPRPGKRFEAGPGEIELVRVSYYVPDASRDCPIGGKVNVRGGRDYTLEEALVGLSLSDAVKLLRREGCSAADYDVLSRYRRSAGPAPTVAAARSFDEKGRDRIRLTVEHAAPALQLSLQPVAPRRARLPLRLGDDDTKSIQLVASKEQRSSFAVAVATRAGVGFKNLRVELRDGSGDLVTTDVTDALGVAVLTADVKDDGGYELWASVTDGEGDSLVGWKPLRAVTLRRDFTGLDGVRYRYAKKGFTVAAAGARARAAQAGEDQTLRELREQARQACQFSFRTSYSSFVSRNAAGLSASEAASVQSISQTACLFSTGQIDLERMRGAGVTPALATLGGTQSLAIGRPDFVEQSSIAFADNRLYSQLSPAIRVGAGALSFVSGDGVTLYANGTYAIQSAGGAAIRAGGPAGRVTVDATAASFAIDRYGGGSFIGIVPGGAGNVVSGGAGNIVANDGATLVSGGAGNIVSGGAGNIVSNDGATIVSAGGGNVASTGSGG